MMRISLSKCTLLNSIIITKYSPFTSRFYSIKTPQNPSVCIVGGGPAGFYTAQQILKLHPTVSVDILEKLPVPFGLVRFGVAPDHQEVKNVINTFTQTANNQRCRFIGNVNVGFDVTVAELETIYDAVALSYGAAADRELGIPGESLQGVFPARNFVGWYNGVPEDENLNPDLSRGDSACIIGQGNVALDITRILLSPVDVLNETDITKVSLQTREKQSKIKNVFIVGRRGPLQVAFTIKELREMIKLPNCSTHIDDYGIEQLRLVKSQMNVVTRPRKRLTELLIKTAEEKLVVNDLNIHLLFLKSPMEIIGDDNGYVKAIKLGQNELIGPLGENQKVVPHSSNETMEIPCSLVIKSIGYKSIRIDETVPFDEKNGVIPNECGRVVGRPGLYCSGWVRRGPTGVIVTTMNDAFETGKMIVEDLNRSNMEDGSPGEKVASLMNLLEERKVEVVTFTDWEVLDAHEKDEGAKWGKPREKLTNVEEMLNLLKS